MASDTSFGGAIKLTGETEYKRALSQITQKLREVSSQMNVVTSAYDKDDKSVAALTAKQNVLNQRLTEQTNKLNTVKNQYALVSAEYQKGANNQEILNRAIATQKGKLDEIGRTLGTTSKEYQFQAKVVDG